MFPDLVFIDFGLGKYSPLQEDTAVDLLVLKKSLMNMNHKLALEYFDLIFDLFRRIEFLNWFLTGIDERVSNFLVFNYLTEIC